jgi:thiol-disulfide isomerase/thioredoxin
MPRHQMLVSSVMPGVVALLAALACALAGGLLWRRGNGRMRTVGNVGAGQRPELPDAASATGDGGQAGTGLAGAGRGLAVAGQRLTSEQLGRDLGERATLVQFSSAFCAPCRATRRILTEVAGMADGVAYIELDAESRLDLVRSLNVLRTPTVLVADADGRIVKRASGQPRKPDVIAALGQAVSNDVSPISGRE